MNILYVFSQQLKRGIPVRQALENSRRTNDL